MRLSICLFSAVISAFFIYLYHTDSYMCCINRGTDFSLLCLAVGHHENGVLKAENGASPRTKKLKSP